MKLWISLNNTIRNVNILSKFKSELKKICYGPRKLKYRHNCTNVDKLYLVYHFLNMHVNYGITVGLEIHKN